MEKFSAIVLAAGKGVRMKASLPKVLHDLNGRPLIYYTIKEILALKKFCSQIIVVVGHKAGAVERALKSEFPDQRIDFAYQRRLLGTADALRCTVNKVRNKNILILCADTPLITKRTLSSFLSFYLKRKRNPSLITAYCDSENDLGKIVRDKEGIICAIKEKVDLNKKYAFTPLRGGSSTEVNSGIYALDKESLFKNLKKIKKNKKKGEYFLTDIVKMLYEKGSPFASYLLKDNEEILGVNRPQDLLIISKIMRQRILEELINKGVKIIDPSTVFIEEGANIGKNTIIFPFTFIEKDVIIASNCSLGPFIYLRKGTRARANTYLGKFLEVSRSKIGRGVKIKHFGYIGDAIIENSVNIGAGTVVANYDGKNKHKTFIGKGAFVGSDTVLVAPLKIGKFAMTGAGSVVTKDVPSKAIVVGVPAKFLKKVKG